MRLCHVPDEVSDARIGGAYDEADRSILPASNALGERENQFLQACGSQGDPCEVEDKNLWLVRMAELCSQTVANESGTLRILE